ncbi:MAG: penicillin-binding protein activator LpoB [Polyangiaceae bacterium]|nr:penicillin-binding protein activator LpoB [Polyangiaceae bacterium]
MPHRRPPRARTASRLVRWAFGLACASALTACGGPTAIRGEDEVGFDDQAMSTGLDKRDLQKLLHENLKALQASAVIERWRSESGPVVAVVPLRNETSEHVDSALEALTSDIETVLVNAGGVRVVSLQNQATIMEEIRRQHADGFAPGDVARWGKQVGARYFVTGKVFSADERIEGERRVQYMMFIQVIEAETSVILFQHKSTVTKGVI